ncbi:MAG: DUF4340 domain-containing protein, partial [Thermoanaerobaculia bacterium]
KADDVTAVLIERPDLPKVELKRGPGGGWRIEAAPPGRADAFTVDGLLADLGRLEVVGRVQTEFDPKEYGLDAPRGKATVTLKDGTKKMISFGKEIPGTDGTAASDGTRMAAVKLAPLAALAKPLNEYRSKRLVDIPTAEITRVTLAKGPNQIVLVREPGAGKTAGGTWRIESPVADLASGPFVERLLADLSSAQISEFPAVSATDLARIGLAPPSALVTVQKGSEAVATLAFGAAKADVTGKIYAKCDSLVVVVDDRVMEEIGKELLAFRETRLLPLDVFRVRRVQFDAGALRIGAEKVDGEWRSADRAPGSAFVEAFLGVLSRAESRGFVVKKDYAARGIVAGPKAVPVATVEILEEGDVSPRVVTFFPAALGGAPAAVAAEVSGRPDALLVEGTLLENLKREATRLRDAAKEAPKPTPGPAAESSASAPASTPAPTPLATPSTKTPRKTPAKAPTKAPAAAPATSS